MSPQKPTVVNRDNVRTGREPTDATGGANARSEAPSAFLVWASSLGGSVTGNRWSSCWRVHR